MTWTSTNGVELRDLVPAADRRGWIASGHCPDRDLYQLYAERETAHPDRDAVIDPSGTVSYAALGDHARKLAGALRAAGLGPRDIIAIRLPGGWPALAADLAVAALGAVALPIPTGQDAATLLLRSRASAVIAADPVALDPAGTQPPWPLPVIDPAARVDGFVAAPVDAEDPARILVSSGTESEPKQIAYSHNAMAGGRGNYLRAVYGDAAPVRCLLLMPLSSSYGSLGLVTLVRHGGTVIPLDRFDPSAALRAIAEHRPSHVFGVPTMLRRMLTRPETVDVSCLRTVVASGMPLDAATRHAFASRFGCRVIDVYGSADGVNCHTARHDTGLGRPDPAVAEIRIAERGEICALGPMTPLCYVNAPELDARYRTADGWTRTGDRGYIDPHGNLHLIDRIKQIVIRGGHNISLAEVEQQLLTHPGVTDAACVPVPDGDLGERLCACVVPRASAAPVSLTQLTDHLGSRPGMDRRKHPELLLLLPELPLGPTGKVCRGTLTRLAAGLARNAAPATPPGTPGR